MSRDLGIRAAVRAAVEADSDSWFARLDGFYATRNWRNTPSWACCMNRPVSADERDGWAMRDFAAHPEWRGLRVGA
jgi:hypothetical protein